MSAGPSVLSEQVRWQQSEILQAGIDQTQLVIEDAPKDPVSFSFLVMGDTDAGDENTAAFAEGFAQQLLSQLGESRFLLHTGDVTYPTGSYKNYLTKFLWPYRDLLESLPRSAAYRHQSIVFNCPLLPVPGNHDYGSGAGKWSRVLRWVCDRLRSGIGIDLGHYGGQGGEAYGQTFLDDLKRLKAGPLSAHLKAHYSAVYEGHDSANYALNYRAGRFTRLPNRYYCFRYGDVEFFALDSNTWKTAPDVLGFDHAQLAWLENCLVQSHQDPAVSARIVYLHHSPYTTEASRWQQQETLWVRRHLRAVLDKVDATVNRSALAPLVNLVLSGHAHCLEHLKTLDTQHGDAQMDWVVCGGSGTSVRSQRKSEDNDILENVVVGSRRSTRKVAKSCFFAGRHGRGARSETFYSFLRVDIRPSTVQKIRVVPFVATHKVGQWTVRSLDSINISNHA